MSEVSLPAFLAGRLRWAGSVLHTACEKMPDDRIAWHPTTEGNPGRVTGPADLPGRRVARRPFGTGTRVLLDQLLADAGIAPASLTGPEAGSHLEVAMTVASGQADTGLAVRAAATALDLGFVPVTWEEFDIVLSGDTLPAAEPLIAALRDPGVQSSVSALGGYDLSRAGSVQLLD